MPPCSCVCRFVCKAAQHQAPGRAWISFRKVSKVYTLLALISMFIRQRKIAGSKRGRAGGREAEEEDDRQGYLKDQ